MTDKELLELAAKATNEKGDRIVPTENGAWYEWYNGGANGRPWNPLTDNNDALRLAVKLNLRLECMTTQTAASTFDRKVSEPVDHTVDQGRTRWPFDQCPYAATRRCITRAAAAIGEGMK